MRVNTETILGTIALLVAACIIFLYITMNEWMSYRTTVSCQDLASKHFKEMPAYCKQYIYGGARM